MGGAAPIFGIGSVLIVADLIRGSNFDLPQGTLGAAVGAGRAVSQIVAGAVERRHDNNAGFLFLAAVALAPSLFLGLGMSETMPTPAPRAPLRR